MSITKVYSDYYEALDYIESKGMNFNYESPFEPRQYFHYGNGDVFLDHSATIDLMPDGSYCVSDFSDRRKI